jgi:hypothetical protein
MLQFQFPLPVQFVVFRGYARKNHILLDTDRVALCGHCLERIDNRKIKITQQLYRTIQSISGQRQ